MTDASGVSAADGVLTEEQVDQPAGQSSTGDSAASDPGTAAGEGTQGRQKGGGRVGLFGASLFGIFVLGVGLILVYILIKIWPKVPHGTGGGGQAAGAQLDPRETSFLSDTQLQITLTGDDVSQPGQLWIGVANPDGGAAEPQSYTIE